MHVETFPSILRLLYNDGLLEELEQNLHRLGELKALRFHRVIDNEPLTIDADNLWINLNYHLMHFVDFMPSANWSTHRADPLLQMFEKTVELAGPRRPTAGPCRDHVSRKRRPPRSAKTAACSAGSAT